MNFKKNKDYLICIDSDGCAIDAMTIKHVKCFGPCIIDEYNLNENAEEILKRWDVINLYSMTRGINRFKGLALILEEINKKHTKIEGLSDFLNWVNTTNELSNKSLIKEIEVNDSVGLKQALSWSNKVNEAVNNLTEDEKKAYPNVLQTLIKAKEFMDIVIVSSANRKAVDEEWEANSLLEHVDLVLTQEDGTKKACIKELVAKGYDLNKMIMVGDAPGDLDAAKANGIYFYPILVNDENNSWINLYSELDNIKNNIFSDEELIIKFKNNLQ